MDTMAPEVAAGTQPLYFSVSRAKFIVMSLCTFGIYELYWFYKNWNLIKERTRQDISPFWRAFFSVFFCHSLIKSIKESAESNGISTAINPGWLTFAYIVLIISWRLPDPYWFVSMLSFLPLMPAQSLINTINKKVAPQSDPNNSFSWKNIVGIILGSILLIFAIIGTFFPE